ncbi:hypothetical protein C0J52_12068, partial [Blattella germanica]
ESGYCAQEKNLPTSVSSITRSGNLEISGGVYINYAQETFSFPFFRDLELSIILIGMVKHVSVLVIFQYSN